MPLYRTAALALLTSLTVAGCTGGHPAGVRALTGSSGPSCSVLAGDCDPGDNPADAWVLEATPTGAGWVSVDDTASPASWIAMIRADDAGEDPYRCLVHVGDTSVVWCADGWTEGS